MAFNMTIYHLEFTANNGGELKTNHSYYTSLTGLHIDNFEELGVSLSTLQHATFPYSKSDYYFDWTIRKGKAFTTKEVRVFSGE